MSPLVSLRFLQSQPDARLVALTRLGHERAFEALIRRYRKQLLFYARRLVGPDERAEDAVQQALMHAWIALGAGADVADVRAWLYRIVHNTAITGIRRQRDHAPLADVADRPALVDEAQARIAWADMIGQIAALPELQREAILLTAIGEQSHEQAGAALGISDGAVRGLVYRARAALRSAAAIVVPTPLVNWLATAGGGRSALPDRIPELIATGGSTGVAGLLLKGGAVAVTAGVIAASQVGLVSQRRAIGAPSPRAATHGVARHPAEAVAKPVTPLVVSTSSPTPTSAIAVSQRAPAAPAPPPVTAVQPTSLVVRSSESDVREPTRPDDHSVTGGPITATRASRDDGNGGTARRHRDE